MNSIDVVPPTGQHAALSGRWLYWAQRSSRHLLRAVGLLGALSTALTISVCPAVAEGTDSLGAERAVPSVASAGDAAVDAAGDAAVDAAGAGVAGSDEPFDPVAEADRERARQRLLDYLQRLRTRPDTPLPEASFPSFGSDVFDAQLAGYLAYVNAVGTPDILIVGSSRALQGIDPTELQVQLADRGYPGLKVYNFSVNGATAQVVNFVLSELLPGELPAVVLWGDGSRAFNDGRRDRTWETLTASPGYQAILRGERPTLDAGVTIETTILGAPGTVVSYGVEAAAVAEVDQMELAALEPAEVEPAEVVVPPEVSLAGTRLNGLTLDGAGFSAVSDRFDPARYYQQFPQVSGQYDGAYSPFALQGAQTVALSQAANAARRQNSQLIFVNLPLSDSYLDDFRLYYEDRFQQFLRTQGDRYGFEVVDLLQAWPGQPDLFADPSHINQHGAAAIAAQLAFEPTLLLALQNRAADFR